jgi:hypothetical protein
MAISWVVALLFLVLSAVFCVLWWRGRAGGAGPSNASSESASDLFDTEQDYQLLGRGELDDGGRTKSYGAVRNARGAVFSFLIDDDITHLNAGDAFRLRNGQMYKVKSEPAPAVSTASPDTASDVPVSAPAATTEAPQASDNDQDDGLTVMVSAAQTDALWRKQVEDSLPTLYALEGADAGSHFMLPFDVTTIGRSESNGVALREEGSSRVHCEIEFVRPNFVVRDLQSTNGTLHNGAPVDVAVLSFGDTITISDTVLQFGCKGFSLAEEDSAAAIEAFEQCLDVEPDFLPAVKNLAFLMERDIRRKKEAQPLWERVAKLEKIAGG